MVKKPTQKPDPDFWQRWGVWLGTVSLLVTVLLGVPTLKSMFGPGSQQDSYNDTSRTPSGSDPSATVLHLASQISGEMFQRHAWLTQLRDALGHLATSSHEDMVFKDAEKVLQHMLLTRQAYLVRYSLKERVEGYWSKVRAYKTNPSDENRRIVVDDCRDVADLISDLHEQLLKRPLSSGITTRPAS